MPEIIETTVYHLEELDETAKDKTHALYREFAISEDWYHFVYEDFEAIAVMLGVQLKTQTIRLYGGGTRQEQRIYFSGFWSQGDGACFEASYRYQPGAVKAIRQHAPEDSELHNIAETLRTIQRRHFYQITADITRRVIITMSMRGTSRSGATAGSRWQGKTSKRLQGHSATWRAGSTTSWNVNMNTKSPTRQSTKHLVQMNTP